MSRSHFKVFKLVIIIFFLAMSNTRDHFCGPSHMCREDFQGAGWIEFLSLHYVHALCRIFVFVTSSVLQNMTEACLNWLKQPTDRRVFSLQFGLSRTSESIFTPACCRLFLLRSSSCRWDALDFRADDRKEQPSAMTRHCFNLQRLKDF